MGVTTVALIDTDSDPDTVDLPIPGNDDSIRSIELMLAKLADAILEGKAALPAEDQSQIKPRPAPAGNGANAPAVAAEPEAGAVSLSRDPWHAEKLVADETARAACVLLQAQLAPAESHSCSSNGVSDEHNFCRGGQGPARPHQRPHDGLQGRPHRGRRRHGEGRRDPAQEEHGHSGQEGRAAKRPRAASPSTSTRPRRSAPSSRCAARVPRSPRASSSCSWPTTWPSRWP